MRRNRKAKIVATLGPGTSSPERIRALFEAGVDTFRLNFSHGAHADHAQRVKSIRALEKRTGRPIGIMVDLQGPKLRVGKFVDGKAMLEAGKPFRLDLVDKPGDARRATLPHPEIFAALAKGSDLLLNDGKIRLKVQRCDAGSADTVVVTGGPIGNHKGVNVPNVFLPISPITDKDRRDLRVGLDLGADWIALSFVQRVEDVAEARRLIAGRAAVMIKLEKPAAIQHLDELIECADGVMVARGDLGVEMPPEDVPGLQKRIVYACREVGRPVVVATQMLESMISAPAPTRAEASDVATAIFDGADAVMLSAETAVGEYPLEAVSFMDRIIQRVEQDQFYLARMEQEHAKPMATTADAISAAARQVAHTISASAIVTFSLSGSTTLRAARERPEAPIIGLTTRPETARRLAVTWGIHGVVTKDVDSYNDMVRHACRIAVKEEFARPGDRVLITAGVPFGTPGATNVLHIARVGQR